MATAKKTAAPSERARAVRTPTDRPRKQPKAAVEDIPLPFDEDDILDIRSEELSEPDLVEVFRLDGKPYYVDRNIGAGVGLKILRSMKRQGEESAVATTLEELLGEQQFDELCNFRGLTPKNFAQILMRCSQVIFGNEESGPKAR